MLNKFEILLDIDLFSIQQYRMSTFPLALYYSNIILITVFYCHNDVSQFNASSLQVDS